MIDWIRHQKMDKKVDQSKKIGINISGSIDLFLYEKKLNFCIFLQFSENGYFSKLEF